MQRNVKPFFFSHTFDRLSTAAQPHDQKNGITIIPWETPDVEFTGKEGPQSHKSLQLLIKQDGLSGDFTLVP